jgi:hypothetical protein
VVSEARGSPRGDREIEEISAPDSGFRPDAARQLMNAWAAKMTFVATRTTDRPACAAGRHIFCPPESPTALAVALHEAAHVASGPCPNTGATGDR